MALDEFNGNLSRIILSLKRPEKKFDWFWDEVKEQDAPKYHEIVKEPMWLGKIGDKARDKEVITIVHKHDYMHVYIHSITSVLLWSSIMYE